MTLSGAILEQRTLFPVRRDSEMLVGELRGHPSSRSSIEKSDLNQKRLVDFFDRIRLFSKCGRQRVHPYRPALVFLDDRQQQFPIYLVEAVAINFEHLQGSLRGRQI